MSKKRKSVEVGKSENTAPVASLSERAAGPLSGSQTKPPAARGNDPARAAGTLIAKKDFLIRHNGYERAIKAGDDISDVPELYHQNLRTEGVL